MDLLKRNMFWILCGVAGAGGIALGVTGLRAMPQVKTEMEAAAAVFSRLDPIRNNPVNQRAIDAEQDRIDSIQEDYEAVLDRAKTLYSYTPLVEGALPDGPPLKRTEFRRKYTDGMNRLFASLNSGGLPTPADIATMTERLENEKAASAQRARGRSGRGQSTQVAATRTPAYVLTAEGVRQDPVVRATIAKAQSFYCYGIDFPDAKPPDRASSLQFSDADLMRDVTTVDAPDPYDVWMAQVGYWIQKDVVAAIVYVNEQAADEAKAAGKDRWVGTMAVKDVISIKLSEYVPSEGDLVAVAPPGGYTPALPPGTGESVFTGSVSGPTYDVIQFSVKLVMDQRDITTLVERLCNNSFYTLLRVAYQAVPTNRDMKKKIYGSEPTVSVVLDFEVVMLGDVFRPLMPESVCDFFEINCAEREDTEEDQG